MKRSVSGLGPAARRVGVCLFAIFLSSGAGATCLDDDKQSVSRALGLLFAHEVLGPYKDVIDPAALLEGVYGMHDTPFDVTSPAGGSGVGGSSSAATAEEIEKAEKAVRDWHRKTRDIDKRFLKAFRARPGTVGTDTMVYRKVSIPDENGFGAAPGCELSGSPAAGSKRVCYRFRAVEERDLCSNGGWASGWTDIPPVTGDFKKEEVIEGWQDLFDLVDDSKAGLADRWIELVVPATFGYGEQGVPGGGGQGGADQVRPGQTLWFLIRFAPESG